MEDGGEQFDMLHTVCLFQMLLDASGSRQYLVDGSEYSPGFTL